MVHVKQKKETGLDIMRVSQVVTQIPILNVVGGSKFGWHPGYMREVKDDIIFFWWTIPLRDHYAVSFRGQKQQKVRRMWKTKT